MRPIMAGMLIAAAALLPAATLAAPASEYDPGVTPADLPQTWVEVDGTVYGAKPNELGPIGGGAGYAKVVTAGDYTARTIEELTAALAKAQPGQVVFVPGDVELDFTSWVLAEKLVLQLPGGVTLASDRGHNGSPGALFRSDEFRTSPLIKAAGADVRFTGIRLRGPDPQIRMDLHNRAFRQGGGSALYYQFPKSDGIDCSSPSLEVDNCELMGWSHAAVSLRQHDGHHIHHNFFHHNQHHGLGYGISHRYGQSLIEYNLFDYGRHHIAGTGASGSGYEAANNVTLGHANSHLFDMHGGRDRGDGTNIAGTWMKVHHNSFWNPDVAAVVIRGVPEEKADIHHNWFWRDDATSRTLRSDGNTYAQDNVYGKSSPKKIAEEYSFEHEAKAGPVVKPAAKAAATPAARR